MKRIILVLLFCSVNLDVWCAGTRNLIMPIDWGKENFEREFSKSQFRLRSEEFGAITSALMVALLEQAAPIIVSSATWGNAVARGKMFSDAIQDKDMSYLQRYPLFSNPQNIAAFKAALRNGYDSKADLMFKNVPDNGQASYYYAYQFFFSKNPAFKPQEWIVKKLSDYVYLLIPHAYMRELSARKDTSIVDEVEYEKGTKQVFQFSTSLTQAERLVGMKFEKFPDMPASALLDMFAHPTRMNYNNYQNLVRPNAFSMVQTLLQYKWEEILTGYLFGQHLIYLLPQILITHTDLKYPGGNKEKTDVNEAYFLPEWLVYLGGHGSPSQPTPVLPVVYDVGGGVRAEIAYTAGIEQGAFREVLGFFNNQVDTGSLLYFSCYSGGPHLFKLFEHNWDYPVTKGARIGKGKQAQKEVHTVADVFNYLIIATNQFYTTTLSPTFGFWFDNPNYWPRLPGTPQYLKQQMGGVQKPNGLEFQNYFKSMAQLLHPEPKVIGQKNGSKKQKIAQMPSLQEDLIKTISYVHQFDFSKNYMIPAIRLPYTEWFVSLADLGEVLRLESQKEWQEREQVRQQAALAIQTREKLLPILQEYKKLKATKPQELDAWIAKLSDQERKMIKTMYASETRVPEPTIAKKQFQEQQKLIREGKELFDRMEKMRLEPEKATYKRLPKKQGQERVPWEKVEPQEEKAQQEKERLEKEEKDRKERELFERMEKMRKEQAERERLKVKPPVVVPPVQPTKPKEPLQPISPNIPVPSAVTPPSGAKPPLATELPPPVVLPPGTKPVQLPTKLPPPPQIPFPGQQVQLPQALRDLENALKTLSTRLR